MLTLIRSLLRLLPASLADKVYYHFLRGSAQRYMQAFRAAPLRYCQHLRMNLNPSDTAHGHLAFTGVYEPELTAHFMRLAKAGGLLVDVGANFGYFSLLWCGLSEKNRSIAFEASPKVLPCLHDNIALNQLGGRIELHELAASNQSGTICFDVGPPNQTGWGGISRVSAGAEVVEVPAARLDSLLNVLEIAVLKIDCEGADFLVLQGAQELLRERRVRHVFFEENPQRMQRLGIAPGSSERLVRSLGYQCAVLAGNEEYHAWIEDLD